MASDIKDLSDTLLAESDQLNAADLVRPVVVTIMGGNRLADKKQPLALRISGGYKPWKPCKGMRRLLVKMWGKDGEAYVGRMVKLYNETTVVYGGKEEGGVRILGMSDIDGPFVHRMREASGKTVDYPIEVLQKKPSAPPPANLEATLAEAELTIADFDRWRGDKPKFAELPEDQRAAIGGYLVANPTHLDAIRALIPQE